MNRRRIRPARPGGRLGATARWRRALARARTRTRTRTGWGAPPLRARGGARRRERGRRHAVVRSQLRLLPPRMRWTRRLRKRRSERRGRRSGAREPRGGRDGAGLVAVVAAGQDRGCGGRATIEVRAGRERARDVVAVRAVRVRVRARRPRGRATGAVAVHLGGDIRGSTTRARVASLAVAVEPSGVTSPDANGLVRARATGHPRAPGSSTAGRSAPRAREARRRGITPRERTTSLPLQRVTPDGTFF